MAGIKIIMSAYVVVAIAIWMMLLEPATIAASDISFDIEAATKVTYAQLLTDVRNKVKDKNIVYGGRKDLPVMAAPSPKYLYVDLKASGERTITIALNLDKSFSLYVVAFLDKINDNENYRKHIFEDFAGIEAKRNAFPDAKGAIREILGFTTVYRSIEEKAGCTRKDLGLGIESLKEYFNEVYGVVVDEPSKNNDKNEARFMLIVIQMLAEAARFAYIENKIVEYFDKKEGYKPDYKTLKLVVNWKTITIGIKDSKKGVISPALRLKTADNKDRKVSKVDDIAPDMGLLKYEGRTMTTDNNRVVSLAFVINKVQRYYNNFIISVFKANNNNGDDDDDGEAAEM